VFGDLFCRLSSLIASYPQIRSASYLERDFVAVEDVFSKQDKRIVFVTRSDPTHKPSDSFNPSLAVGSVLTTVVERMGAN
jgi:hypothetical protein